MMHQLLPVLLLSTCFLVLFIGAELLYHFGKVKADITRKIVHIGSGLITLLFPVYLTFLGQVTLLCSSFLILLLLSRKFNFLPSINKVDRVTYGSLFYPVIVWLVFAFYLHFKVQSDTLFLSNFYYFTPILIMAICDPLAEWAGKLSVRHQLQPAVGKTIAGSMTFFIGAFLLSILLILSNEKQPFSIRFILIIAFPLAVITTFTERISQKGWDNFTIPIAAAAFIFLIEKFL